MIKNGNSRLTTAVLITNRPTPQRSPLLDKIANEHSLRLDVIYLSTDSAGRGWGRIGLDHPHKFVGGRGTFAAVRTLTTLIRKKPNVVLVFGYSSLPHILAVYYARFAGVRLVMRSDSNIHVEAAKRLWFRTFKKLFLQVLLGRRVEVWTIGNANARYWTSYGFENQTRVPYTMGALPGTEGDSPLSDFSGLTVGFLGRLLAKKGIDLALESARTYSGPDCRFVFAGDGPEAVQVRNAAMHNPYVLWLGSVPYSSIGHVFQRCDIVVVPSYFEPWGLVVLEALALGAMVLVFDQVGAAHDLRDTWPDKLHTIPSGDAEAFKLRLGQLIRSSLDSRAPEREYGLRTYPSSDEVALSMVRSLV